uniref:Cytochrome b5 heme-binding domain-containing protein n=1 Tax=Globisporangium ultimum (strain ATCC 200006 / CBS 805.95 / DAOM BR144) TaxID=431595 RepID=K3WHX2_GLOUD
MSALPAPRPVAYCRSNSSSNDEAVAVAGLGLPRMPVLVNSPRHKEADDATAPVVVVPPNVTKGNRLVQFMVFSAVACTLYQFVTHGSSQLTMKTDTTVGAQFGSSEYTCILACMGLFGLIRHKAKEAKKRAVDEEVEDEDDELTRELRLTEKLVRNQRKHTGKNENVAAIKKNRQSPTNACKNAVADTDVLSNQQQPPGIEALPLDVLHELLLFLSPKDLAACPMVSKQMNVVTGDASDSLWRLVFQRDFEETGERFQVVFPIESWRQFYFQHHLSRAVEIARLLGLQEDKKCVAIEDHVYDVTAFLHSHPGGYHVIGDVIGTDATEIWDQFQHSQEAKESMKEFMVDDPILCNREAHPRLHGNLAIVITRWQRISWCITNAHNFGPMASTFTDVVLRFHARSIKKSRDLATPRVSN